jgi:hypothetical protein
VSAVSEYIYLWSKRVSVWSVDPEYIYKFQTFIYLFQNHYPFPFHLILLGEMSKRYTTSIHKYITPLIFFENFGHFSYSIYLFKNVKF